jgi:hypothetical protein
MQLCYLEAIREQAKQRAFEPWQVTRLESFYEKKQGGREARVTKLLRACRTGTPACPTERTAQSIQPVPEVAEPSGTGKSACATDEYQDLLRLLDKVRILLAMRKELREPKLPRDLFEDQTEAEKADLDQLVEPNLPAEAPVPEGPAPTDASPSKAAEQGARPAAARQEKVNERPGNVYENKGRPMTAAERREPAAQGARSPERAKCLSRPAPRLRGASNLVFTLPRPARKPFA